MKKKHNNLKGMTLVEVLVALAVFTIISALLASACANVTSIIKKTDRLNKKNSIEAPEAEKGLGSIVTNSDGTNKEETLIIKIDGTEYNVDVNKHITDDAGSSYEEGGNYKYFSVK